MKSLRFPALLLLIIVTIASCKRTAPKQAKYIPKDASVVFSISPQRIQEKIEKSNINFDSLMRNITQSGRDSSKITLTDLKNSGLDFTSNIYFFTNQRGSIMTPRSIETGVIAVLKDADAFEKFLKKQKPELQVQKASGYSYADLKEGSAVGWSKDIVIVSNISMNYNNNNSNSNSSVNMLNTLFNQKESESVGTIKEFSDLTSEKADMLFWTNSSSSISAIPFVGLSKAADLFKDAYTAGKINFEDGKVEMDTKSYVGKDLRDILEKHKSPNADLSMVEKYPYPVNGFSVFSFDPKMVTDILQYIGAEPTANQFLQDLGITVDDITKAFKGDFAVVASNFGITEKASPYNPDQKYSSPDAKFLFNAKVGDVASYNKVMNALVTKGFFEKNGDVYMLNHNNPEMNTGDKFVMSADQKNILIATGSDLIDAYKKGNGNAGIPHAVKSEINNKAFAIYVDVAGILKAIPKDTIANSMNMDNAARTFKYVILTADNFDGHSINGMFELHTMNDKENSLVTLINYFNSVADNFKTQRNGDAILEPMPGTEPDSSNSDHEKDSE